jgi:uncharacterized linocin/CFP29 family protein
MEISNGLQIQAWQPGTPLTYLGSRPISRRTQSGGIQVNVDPRTGLLRINTERGLVVNSQLRRDEWQRLDAAIQQAALTRLNAVADLKAMGLTEPIGSFGTLTSQWSQESEMTTANVNMTGQSAGNQDRLDYKIAGRPIPVIFKDFTIPTRQLEASRLMNNPLDTSHARTAARVVAEQLEGMLVNGYSGVVFDSNTIYGYTTEANRNTDTATNYCGGDWGTLSNVVATVSGMVGAAIADRHYGPYILYVAPTQHNQAATQFYSDGSGDSGITRTLKIDSIQAIKPCDTLADGVAVLVQMDKDTVDWAEHMDVSVVEWMSGDGMVGHFKVMAVATPRVKSDYNARSGIVHATGC